MTYYDSIRYVISKLNLRYEDECYLFGFLDACGGSNDFLNECSPFLQKLVDCIERKSND